MYTVIVACIHKLYNVYIRILPTIIGISYYYNVYKNELVWYMY